MPVSAPSPALQLVAPANESASAVPVLRREPEPAAAARASEVKAVPAIDLPAAPPQQAVLDKTAVAKVSLTQRLSEFMAENWRWIVALVLLPITGWLWAWFMHRRAYDEAGLPRGPKL